ncbi:MAG: hypothetical protein IPI07_10485 [Flavobacteriales bacterium]|nr:hypothetical protein [Flavobacteriales bacterium]
MWTLKGCGRSIWRTFSKPWLGCGSSRTKVRKILLRIFGTGRNNFASRATRNLPRPFAGGHLHGCPCSRRGRDLLRHEGRSTCRCRDRTGDLDDPQAAWRLRVPEDRRVVVRSLFGTDISADLFAVMPDPVLRQRATNGSSARPAYQLASLADDVDQGITFIVRGQDLWPSTVCQVYLAGLLGMTPFQEVRFVHHPLLQDQAGNKLSKSEGALSIRAMRGRGADPVELRAMAKAMLTRIEGKAGSGA